MKAAIHMNKYEAKETLDNPSPQGCVGLPQHKQQRNLLGVEHWVSLIGTDDEHRK